MLIEGSDYHVRLMPFPVSVGGMVMPNADGSFSVYINSNLSQEQQKKAMRHELEHIEADDFYNGKPITDMENI